MSRDEMDNLRSDEATSAAGVPTGGIELPETRAAEEAPDARPGLRGESAPVAFHSAGEGTGGTLVDTYLDGELTDAEMAAMAPRIEREPELAEALRHASGERALRLQAFAAMEGDDAAVERVLAGVHASVRKQAWRATVLRATRYIGAAAACIVVGFIVGYVIRNDSATGSNPPTAHGSGVVTYNVAITDEEGRVVAVQPFRTLEQAKQFSEDLHRWQEQQDRLRNGQVTVRSASF